MSLWSADNYEIRETEGKGRGLFALRAFQRGEAIFPFDYWSEEPTPMHISNHSCDANGSFADGQLIAQRDIAAGEEITFNYLQHPTPASPWNFACHCNAPNCVGWVKAAT